MALKLNELKTGEVYRDRLSGLKVFVPMRKDYIKPEEFKEMNQTPWLFVLPYYNPVTGQIDEMRVYNDQLEEWKEDDGMVHVKIK